MSEIKRVKIGSLLESQIPEFLVNESPLLVDFLEQYYKSLEYQSGSIDIISNITNYKNGKKFNNIDLIEKTTLTSEILTFDQKINVTSTRGWPDTYGLLKIDDEIITYTSKTNTSFEGCIRGFSGIENLKALDNPEFAIFSSTQSSEHKSGASVKNLSNLFLIEFFEKFKYEFLPGFESRDFYENLSIENVSYKIKDLYSSKGTDQSYKLLFKILYGSDIEIIKPQEFTLTPSSNSYFLTKNILVEKVSGGNPTDIKGNFLFQEIAGIGTVSASIFNVEYRPVSNKNFYEISLDSTSFTGIFQASGKTRILEDVAVNSNNIIVDSTVGFANSGSLLVKPKNSDFITINYSGKNINQFTGVTNVTKPLDFGLDLVESKFAFSYVGLGNTSKVEFRVVNVIDNIDFSKTSNLRVGDTISLSSFGRDLFNRFEFNSWIYNLPTNHDINVISQVNATTYRVQLFDKIYFYVGEPILLINSNEQTLEVNIISIEYSPSDIVKKYSQTILVQITTSASFNILSSIKIRKKIYKTNHFSNYFSNLNLIPTSVQNTYIDSKEEYFYVTSSGLPNYTIFSTDNKKSLSTNAGISKTDTFNVTNHNYLSGEVVYYKPQQVSGIQTGLYFVTKVDNNKLKFSYSRSDVFSKKYITTTIPITNDILFTSGYQDKTIKHQKLLKKFPFNRIKAAFDDLNERTTFNRELGLLNNGVELLSPTLFDENIYYGTVSSINVTNKGQDYDLIDVPPIVVNDDTGSGCKAHVNLSGTVREIKILNAGYGYQDKPKITIIGGNGRGCVLESNFVNTQISAGFKADLNVIPAANTIQFLNTVPFEDGEQIIYDSNNNSNILGIVNGSTYFVGILTDNKIKLFNNRIDALQKTSEIDIIGISSGFHFIRTLKNKNTFTKIYVKDPGEGYSNRKIKVPSILSADNRTLGINTFDSYIFAKNHGFSNGEVVIYSSTNTAISGLSSISYYKVKVIDNDKFRLYNSGVSTSLSDENYIKNKFVKFNSLGIGTHIIGYPPIEVRVESKSGTGATTNIKSELKPIVLGVIEDVYVEDGGIGYGCTNIVNYHRRPNTGIASITSEAILKPIIINGSIVDVQIIGRGNGFRENSEISISGEGSYAQIEPIVQDGKLFAVNIVFGGVGYDSKTTILTLKNRGLNAKFLTNITEWKINQVVKSKNIINNDDDGVLYSSKNPELELQFINFYVPKKLRYQLSDNLGQNNKENTGTLNHSPILGYAYDGNPIYGPYAYDTTTGGFIRRMNPSYILNIDLTPGKRPPLFENGFFINDYIFDGSGDLDQHNGRFSITPEYPNGVYAYYNTIELNAANEPVPKYPYVVGPYFYNKPVKENFLPGFNQDSKIFDTSLTRNVGPYYLNSANSSYDLIDKVLEEYKQEFIITEINSGKIEDVSIFSAGDNYKVNDPVEIDISDTGGIQSNVVVSELQGREITNFSLIEDKITNYEVIVSIPDTIIRTSSPHGVVNGQPVLISGVSTITALSLQGVKYAKVAEKKSELLESIGDLNSTGISTFIKVKDVNGFKSNDFIGIGTEILLITNVDIRRSGFFVNRLQNTGIHSVGIDTVFLLPKEFKIATIGGDIRDSGLQPLTGVPTVELNDSSNYRLENYTTFFDPRFTVGIGTSGSTRNVVGVGSTSQFEIRFIPTRSIFIPGHKFFTGQPLIYNSGSGIAGTSLFVNNVGSSVSFKLQDNQLVYAVNLGRDYVGLSTIGFTSSIGIGTTNNCLQFWDQEKAYGVIGAAHSLTTINPKITGTLQKSVGIVTTKTNHNLKVGDRIKFNISTTYNEVIKVIFDPVNRKILMREIPFSNSNVSVNDDTIDISSYSGNINTGDKLVYIAQNPINGLSNYGIYYVSKTNFNSIKLCQHRSDIFESKFINFSSTGGSNQKLYYINPQISCIRTTKIEFDLSDSSLLNLNLQFYYDVNFIERINERSGFFVTRTAIPGNTGAKVILDLSEQNFPIYYKFSSQGSSEESKKQISTDYDVISNNKISIINHKLNDTFVVTTVPSSKKFIFDNNKNLTDIEKQILVQNLTKFSYKTTSTNALGPVSELKINFEGRGYKKLPIVKRIKSTLGTNAVVKLISPTIGRVETFDRVKDGFDYPTDPTLSPFLSVPTIIGVKDIRTINYIGIVTGGRRLNTAPKLIVRNDTNGIELASNVSAGSVVSVDIIKNSTSISNPLEIFTIHNSNGYEIDSVSISGNLVTLELTNSIASNNPFIPSGFGETAYTFPFAPGDQIFIENCRITPSTAQLANFNSSSYDYRFFDVVGVSSVNNTVTYDMAGIATGGFGTYDDDFGLGSVINKKDLPVFEMVLKDDVNYFSNEKISSAKFSGVIMENGWDNKLNQMRLKNISGEINVLDKIFGDTSRINGTVEYFDVFNLYATLGISRDKRSSIDLSSGILNEYSQRISDNFYYQKFSYSIRSDVPYNIWRESVRSIVHPSGFKEFSDLEIFTQATLNEVNVGISKSTNMRPKLLGNDSSTFINVDSVINFSNKQNFARVYEEETLSDGSTQNIFFDGGIDLSSFIVNKTNKVIQVDDISNQFDGTSVQDLRDRFADASDLIDGNRLFIQEEVVGFITATYPGITTNPDWDRDVCARDVGLVVDAVSHDLKYNSNNKTVEAALSYWSTVDGINYVDGETTETIAGFKYIVDLTKFIINNTGVKTSYQLANSVGINSLVYNNITGISTVGTTTFHGLSTTTTNYVVLKNITLSCNSGGGITTAIFPSLGAGPDGNASLSPKGFVYKVEVIDGVTFRVNTGPSTITHDYVNGGTVQRAFISTTQYSNTTILPDINCNLSYSENCCADVQSAISNYIGIITSVIGIGVTAAPSIITYPSIQRGGGIVGLTTFKLKNNGTPLFKHQVSSNNINSVTDTFIIPNHNFQSGQELIYSYSNGSPIGIATTSYVSGITSTLMQVHNFNGTAVLENGYSVAITTSITGVGTVLVPVGPTSKSYVQVIGITTTGSTAEFTVFRSYSSTTGQPLSTSILPTKGGKGYSVGQTVSIAGTYLGGATPTNDLTFVISKTGPTVISGQSNQSYLSVPSNDSSGATFDISRDSSGAINFVGVLNGGSGYASTSIVSVAGTYIGGTDSNDNLTFSPLELGTKVLPKSLFVYKLNDNEFKLSGLSTSVFLDITGVGTAIHHLEYKEPNHSILVTIDGIIQKALTRKPLNVSLASSVSTASTTILTISSGISSLAKNDIINLADELVSIKTIGVSSANKIEVVRGYFGSVAASHTVGTSVTVLNGNFNIIGDVIYFDTAPYGKIGRVGLLTGSIFNARVFSRKFDPSVPQDKNLLIDDLTLSFTGIAATQFTIKSKGQTVNSLFNTVNSSTEISNNPIITINNVSQNPLEDFTIDGSGTNTLKFLSGVPKAGKISKVAVSTSHGYIPRIGAAATATVSVTGTISSVRVSGGGSGYRSAPVVSIAATVGFGASITALVSAAGTITGFVIVNAGTGYTTIPEKSSPKVVIGIPTGYSNLSLGYTSGSSGSGQKAKLTVEVSLGSSIISYKFDEPGVGYRVGDKLTPLGIKTNTTFRYDTLSISNLTYNNLTGITTITTSNSHNLNESDDVILTGIAFTCGYDEVGIKTFSYDNVTGVSTIVTYSPHGLLRTDVPYNQTGNEVFLYNLPFNCPSYTTNAAVNISNVVYNHIAGIATITTSSNHGAVTGKQVKLAGIAFSCAAHSATGIATYNITNFVYTNSTGITTITLNANHGLIPGEYVQLADIILSCPSEAIGYSTTKFPYSAGIGTLGNSYPNSSPNTLGGTFNVFRVLAGTSGATIVFYAGISTVAHTYSSGGTATVGITSTIYPYPGSSPNAVSGTFDVFKVNSVLSNTQFTINAGVSSIAHTYVSGGTAQSGVTTTIFPDGTSTYGKVFPVLTSLGSTSFTINSGISTIPHVFVGWPEIGITTFKYTNTTGIATATTSTNHGYLIGDKVTLAGLSLTCPGYVQNPIVNITNLVYDKVSGIATITTASNHLAIKGKQIKLAGIALTCPSGSGITSTIFPYPGSSSNTLSNWDIFKVNSIISNTKFTINVGISSIAHTYVSGGTAQAGITSTIYPYPGSSIYGATFTVTGITTNTFTFNAGISTIVHNYVSGGITKKVPTMQRILRYTESSGDGAYEFGVISVASTNTFTIQAGSISSIPHYYVQGGIVSFKQYQPFILTVEEVETDSFSGFYPGQFIKFDDISQFFNGFRKKFTLSTTINGVKQVLGLRVPVGTNLDVTNNIFIYINDVLQVPNSSYKFSGSRVIFTEAPKPGSKCFILYYRGSSNDVELIVPPPTIKPGDKVIIQENPEDPFDISQFDRVVKKITASDQLETFNYYSVGIITDPTKIRPLTWQKQISDTVISGTLYSKSRPSFQSNIRPSATVIKTISPQDSAIYVDNAYPLFSDLDQLAEDIRDLFIFEDKSITSALGQAVVSSSSTISSVVVTNGGVGYANTQSPKVVISKSAIKLKDPIFNWKFATGVTTSYDFKSIQYKDKFVAIGSSSVFATSSDGISWQVDTVGFSQTSNFNSIQVVGVGTSNLLVAAGTAGKIIRATDSGSVISSWTKIPLEEDIIVLGIGAVGRVGSAYTGTFNQIVYSNSVNTWVAVGAGGSIFIGNGISTSSFVSRYSETLSDFNSVVFGNTYFVAVGNNGTIRTSDTGTIWENTASPVTNNLNKIIYVNGDFIIVGNQGIILKSINRDNYQLISNNLGAENLVNIYYNYGFYVAVTSSGQLYYSFNLTNWVYRSTLQSKNVNDLIFTNNIGSDGRYVLVGTGSTIMYADPVYNSATATATTNNGSVTSIQIVNPGFGYGFGSSPPVLIESDTYKTEFVKSFKAVGDHGIIVGIITYIAGTPGIGTTSPKISFTLKSEQYDNSTLGVGYSALNAFGIVNSQLSKGDYFVITDSNVQTGGDLVGITTLLGGMSNYPNSKIGIAKSFLDGVYIVEDITTPSVGIVTVTCNFAPMVDNYVKVYSRGSNNTGIGTNNFYGRYSWGKIYDYQNRVLGNPQTFTALTDNGSSGLSTSPKVIRTRNIISK